LVLSFFFCFVGAGDADKRNQNSLFILEIKVFRLIEIDGGMSVNKQHKSPRML
jgi:hypothetical protein